MYDVRCNARSESYEAACSINASHIRWIKHNGGEYVLWLCDMHVSNFNFESASFNLESVISKAGLEI